MSQPTVEQPRDMYMNLGLEILWALEGFGRRDYTTLYEGCCIP